MSRLYIRKMTALSIVAVTIILWLHGFSQSLFVQTATDRTRLHATPETAEEPGAHRMNELLAEAYWTRYPDIRTDPRYGEKSRPGVRGPYEHFRRFGRKEGRIFAPLPEIGNLPLEARLAEAYWQRYPEVERSPVWGRNGSLGILGPRDHYIHRGSAAGMVWGTDQQTN